MTDKLANLQAAERALRQRYTMNGSQNDEVEIDALARDLRDGAIVSVSNEIPLCPGYLFCDCICNCGTMVQVVRPPRKGTNDVLCMTCLELHNRHDAGHQPWPESGVVILPPETKK